MDFEKKLITALMKMTQISNDIRWTYQEKLQLILGEVVNCIGAGKGSIMICEEAEHLEVVASIDPRLIGIRQKLAETSPATWVFLNLKPLYLENGVHDGPPLRNKFKNYQKDAFLVVPILCGDRAIGVLSVTEKQGPDMFSSDDQETLITFAGQLISAIQNHRLNEKLKLNQTALEDRNQRLEKLEKLRTDLFNMLVHDLKGPISEIVANIDILSYMVDGEALEYVASAQAGCEGLYRMISDILDIARMEDGNPMLAEELLFPEEIISSAISSVHSIARTRSVNLFERRPEREDSVRFYGDRGMLVRVLQNLLINAIQYSQENDTVEIGYAAADPGHIAFYVRDQGPGVSPEYQRRIFDKFFQVNEKGGKRAYSMGLGLAFCKMAVTAHNGDILIESDGKKGSLFRFTIPRLSSEFIS